MRSKRRLVATLLFSTAVGPGCVSDRPPPDDQADPQLLELRRELVNVPKPDALARTDHFRPICDDDGYPLVGNVVNKAPAVGYQPSEFCGEVRERN